MTTNVEHTRAFIAEVRELAEKHGLSFFVVTEGASATVNKGCDAVRNARNAHSAWERDNGVDPDHDFRYDPPMTAVQISATYSEELYSKLVADPAHRWRMETGIEIIHREPSLNEQWRIYKNWLLMSDDQKEQSDAKSLELFGKTNLQHHAEIVKSYL